MGRIKRIRYRFGNMSLSKTFFSYVVIALVCASVLTILTYSIFISMVNRVEHETIIGSYGPITISRPSNDYSIIDRAIIVLVHVGSVVAPIVYFVGCIWTAARRFYTLRLKRPMDILTKSAEMIANSDLNFNIVYEKNDEMGTLCRSFEKMRGQLEENNGQMWRMMEEHKRLNAAFAHDLRTPLTVLKGYADFLKDYVPEGKVDDDKLMSIISTMSDHIYRLESYVDTMNTVQKLDDIDVVAEKTNVGEFLGELSDSMKMVCESGGKAFVFTNRCPDDFMALDQKIVARVVENLISNAVCYAHSSVGMTCREDGKFFVVAVSDDGCGFSPNDMKMATNPYYKDRKHANSHHFGLGLHICKVLCERHGGGIVLSNGDDGGAVVTASFSTIVD